jgi:hypothetical protein
MPWEASIAAQLGQAREIDVIVAAPGHPGSPVPHRGAYV